MANDLSTHVANPAQMISSPALLRLRRISMGTVTWPGQPTRTYLSGGSTLTPSQRDEAEAAKRELTAAITALDDEKTRKARFAIITDLLLSKPIAGASADVGRARGGAYVQALDDVPPWAIAAVVRKWRRGECGDERNYTWAPDEALLRKLALDELTPLRDALVHIGGLLTAIPLDEVMQMGQANEADREYVNTGFQKLKDALRGLADKPADTPSPAAPAEQQAAE